MPLATAILREVAQWLAERGDALWDASELTADEARLRAANGELVIAFARGEAIGCLYLQREDPELWADDAPGEALYVHRLAVIRSHAGQGLSRALLDWACNEARTRGARFVRLDTELRPRLMAHYESAGFVRVDAEPLRLREHRVVRFERRV